MFVPNKPGGASIDAIDLVYRYRKLLILGLLVGLVLGYLGYKKVGPVFLAESQVLVSRKVNVPIKEDARMTFTDRSVHVTLIKSPLIVQRAFDEGNLAALPTLAKSKEPVQDIIESLKINRITGEDHSAQNVLGLEYRNRSEADAIKIVDAVIAAYKSYLKESSSQNANEMFEKITEANQRLGTELKQKQEEYQTFRATSPVHFKSATGLDGGTTSNVVNIYQDQADAIALEQRQLRVRRLNVNSQIKTLEEALNDGESTEALQMLVRQFMQSQQQGNTAQSAAPIAGGRVTMETQLIPLMLEEQKLLRNYGDAHPEVQNSRKRIQTVLDYYRRQGITVPTFARKTKSNNLQIDPSDITNIYVQSLKRQLVELDYREEQLALAYEGTSVKAKEYARYQATDQTMSEEVERTKSLYNIVVKQLKEVDLDKENKGFSLQQISPVRAEIDFKRVLKFVGGGGFMGIACVLCLAYLKELQDTTVKSMHEVSDVVNGSMLGSVPTFVDPAVNLKAARHTGLDPMLYYVHQPGSAEAESYRSVRTALFVRAASENAQVIQVTSAEPGDGKTTSVSNLAAAVAQSGKRVLVIDADLRRPTVHKLFGLKDSFGLSTLLEGDTEFDLAVQSTQIGGLSVIASGPLPEKPAELLASPKLPALIQWARENYDIVFIDSPPILAVSDPCIVAPLTDGLMLVVRMNKNKRASLVRVRETLTSHGIKTLGIIANGIATSSSGEYTYAGEYAGRYGSAGYLKPAVPSAKETVGASSN